MTGPSVSYGFDVNQLGASKGVRLAIHQQSAYVDAIVEDIIINESHALYSADGYNVGQAKIRMLNQDANIPSNVLHWANPIESNIQEYPLINEIVLVFYALGQLYYGRKLNISRKITEHTLGSVTSEYGPKYKKQTTENIVLSAAGGNVSSDTTTAPTPKWVELPVRPLRHCEGDIILQGRFGQSVRFGSSEFSSGENVSPNLLLSVGQAPAIETSTGDSSSPLQALVQENINRDKSVLWLVADETVPFLPSTALSQNTNKAHLRSVSGKTTIYSGSQAFLSSDRVIINSKLNEVSIFSNKDVNLSALKNITIDAEGSILMSSNIDTVIRSWGDITLKARNISIISEKDLSYKTAGTYSILGQKIFIGSGNDESEPMVLGSSLSEFMKVALTALSSPGAILTPAGPGTLSPTAMFKIQQLIQALGTGKNAVFNSTDNFVTKNNQ